MRRIARPRLFATIAVAWVLCLTPWLVSYKHSRNAGFGYGDHGLFVHSYGGTAQVSWFADDGRVIVRIDKCFAGFHVTTTDHSAFLAVSYGWSLVVCFALSAASINFRRKKEPRLL